MSIFLSEYGRLFFHRELGLVPNCFSKSLQPAFLVFSLFSLYLLGCYRSWDLWFCAASQACPISSSWVGLRYSQFITVHLSALQSPKKQVITITYFFSLCPTLCLFLPIKIKPLKPLKKIINSIGKIFIMYLKVEQFHNAVS